MFNNSMKQLTIILLSLIGVAYGQSQPTSAKTRFVNGLYVGTKLDSYFNTADSNAIYWRADSVVMAKYKGTARALAFAVSGGYIPYSDTTLLFGNFVRTFGTQTVGGNKTFSNDIVVNGLTVGRGNGNNSLNTVLGASALANSSSFGNTAIGSSALTASTSGQNNTALGSNSLTSNTTGSNNVSLGRGSMTANTTGTGNTAVGISALDNNTTGTGNTAVGGDAGKLTASSGNNSTSSTSTYIGTATKSSASGNSNETVIGYDAIGNGSNTVTIGNSSVSDNYFSGTIRGTQLRVTDSIVGGGARFTGNISGTTIGMSGDAQFNANVSVLGTLLVNTLTTDGVNDALINGGLKAWGITPYANNTYNLGTSSLKWNDIFSGNSIEISKDGSNSIAGGGYYALSNTARNRLIIQQLNASNGIDYWYFNGTAWANVATISNAGVATFSQYRLSALNTAPSSASDTGTLGEIRIDANYIYVCTATNTWKRVAIATW